MSKAVFFCVGTGGHVLPVSNIVENISKKGINKSDIFVITDKRGEQYFKESSLEVITYPFVSSTPWRRRIHQFLEGGTLSF